MMNPNRNNRERYPSPSQPVQGPHLPFYQHASVTSHHQHGTLPPTDDERQSGESQSPDVGPPHEVPDDPALRSHLANMMGNFGVFHTPQFHAIEGEQLNVSRPPVTQETTSTAQAAGVDKRASTRMKVSRACDECRRKKIRCDVADESAPGPCTNCMRVGSTCAFSRQPMKRGPSKGYIKELAERLNTLERQVHPPGQLQQAHQDEIQRIQREIADESSGHNPDVSVRSPDSRIGEKRSFATMQMSQGETRHTIAPQFQQYSQQQRHGQPQPFWRHGASENRPDDTALMYEAAEATTDITNFDWDESVIEEYFRIIHQTFPLLPNNKNRLRQKLAECPTSLREAFLAALDCLLRTFPTTTLQPNSNYPQALKKAAELLAKYPFDNPSEHTTATHLVYLQTLLLMALEADNHGPATIRGQAGPSRAEWLGRAAGVAGQLEINVFRSGSQSIMESDRDSEERLARRAWWVLFILDRWHASSTADLLKLPENSVVLLPEDQMLLGESTYHLARLSFIIGHLASILTTTKTPSTDVMAPSNPASSLLGLTLAGEIDRFRESVESVWGSLNLVHLSYHHCHLLIKRLSPTTEPTDLCGHAVKVAAVLNSRLTPVTPLNHHFGALAAMTLCELADVPRTRADARRGLDHLYQALGEGHGLAGRIESTGWDGAVRDLVRRKREILAVDDEVGIDTLNGGGNAASENKFDPTMLTRYGYLNALGQGHFQI